MIIREVLQELETYGNETRLKSYKKQNDNYSGYGALLGKIRKLAKKIKTNHSLGLELWNTGNTDAQVLSTMLFDYQKFYLDDVIEIVESIEFPPLVGEFVPNIANAEYSEDLIDMWIESKDNVLGKAGFMIIVRKAIDLTLDKLKIDSYLIIIEKYMKDAPKDKKETMNRALVEIGVMYNDFTQRAIDIGEKLEVYKDMKVSKGCYSPYAPNWINLMLERNKNK